MLVLGLAAAALLVAAELSTLREVDVVTATCEDLADPAQREECRTTGGEQHGYALLAVAVLTALMAWGAGMGASRPAAGALLVAAAVVVGIALVGDLPGLDDEGALGASFARAEAQAGPAFALELGGAGLALLAGLVRLLAPRRAEDDG